MNIEQVKATLTRGDRAADAARATMAQALNKINDAARLATATHDSRHPHVQRGHERLKQAHAEAETVLELLAAAAKAADTYRGTLG
jgi:hypothetical protein